MNIIFGILVEAWNVLLLSSPYIMLGFLIAGVIHTFLPDESIAKYLGRGKLRSVVNAALVGIPLPLCSCGVVPTTFSLREKGASKGAVASFLISTPESGVDSIALTYGLFDPVMTIARPVAGFGAAICAGFLVNLSDLDEHVQQDDEQPCGCKSKENSPSTYKNFGERLKEAFRYGFISLVGDIATWFIIGILLAGIISYLIPANFIEQYLGGGLMTMLIMLLVGIPLYVCASASTPIAAALVLKGLSPGAALVFLMAGPATNIASLTVIARFFGKKFVSIYLSVIAVMSVAFGMLLDQVYSWLQLKPVALSEHAHQMFSNDFKYLSTAVFLSLLIYSYFRKAKSQS